MKTDDAKSCTHIRNKYMKMNNVLKTECCKAPFRTHYRTLRCSKCFAPQKCKEAPWTEDDKKDLQADSMLDEIQYLAMDIMMLSMTAKRELDEKERDAMVELIIKRTNEIEKQYSTNWN